jgi:uncharacterized protein YndB with AHSA1/START domain
MRSADGMVFPLTGIFHQVLPFRQISFTARSFADEAGTPQMVTVNNVTFGVSGNAAVFELEVKITRATPIVKASLGEMEQGWSQGLDKLEQFLLSKKIHSL